MCFDFQKSAQKEFMVELYEHSEHYRNDGMES